MPIERDGRRRNARASAPTFPPDEASTNDRPSRADASHIARRRASSAPAHEVDFGEVEIVDEAPQSGRRALPPLPTPPSFRPSLPPAGPIEPFSENAPFQLPITVGVVRRRSNVLTALACGGIALVIGTAAGLTFRPRSTLPLLRMSAGTVAVPTSTATVKSEVPVVDVANLPRATPGTVLGAPGHRLWIDGVLAADWRAIVPCGIHVVQVGSAGTPRTVDIPCGESITVSP